MKKGRHRRFEEARALKRSSEPTLDELADRRDEEPCPECSADPGHDHASWCLFEEDLAGDGGTGEAPAEDSGG